MAGFPGQGSLPSSVGRTIEVETQTIDDFVSGNSLENLSVKNRLDEAKFGCFPVKRTLRRQECTPGRSGGERTVYLIYRAQRSGFHRRAALLRADSDRTRPMRGVKCSESFWQPVSGELIRWQ